MRVELHFSNVYFSTGSGKLQKQTPKITSGTVHKEF